MALPPFQQNLMQSSALQKKKKVEEELGKPAFKAQGLANQQPQVPAFQPAKKAEAPKDLQPPKTLQPAAFITATPQAQPQPMLQTPKAVLEAPKTVFTPMPPPAMPPVATPAAPTLPTLPTLQPPAMAPPAMPPLAQAPALDRILAPLLPPTLERPVSPPEMAPPVMERPMPLAPKPSDINLGNILGPLTQPAEQPKPSLAPTLEGLLKPVGELPPLLRPQPPTFSPSAQLPQLPPRAGSEGLPARPNLAGVLNPMLQRELPTKNDAFLSDAIKTAIRPDKTELTKPVALSTGGVPALNQPATASGPPALPGNVGGSSGASKFINFDRLLSTNVPGATEMAQKALTETFDRGRKAEAGVGQLGRTFGEQVKQGTQTYSGEPIGQTGNQAYEAFKALNTDVMQGMNPNAGTVSLEEARQRAAQGYKGPEMSAFYTSPEYQQAQKDVQKAAEATKAMGSESGLEALLNQMYGTAGGTGGSRLDMALARVAGGPAYDTTQKRFAKVDSLLTNAAQKAQQQVGEGQAASADAQAFWKDAVNRKTQDIKGYEDLAAENERKRLAEANKPVAQEFTSSFTGGAEKPASQMTTQGTASKMLIGPYPDGTYKDETGRKVDANGNPI